MYVKDKNGKFKSVTKHKSIYEYSNMLAKGVILTHFLRSYYLAQLLKYGSEEKGS